MCEQHIDRKCTSCGWGLPLLERKRLRTEKRQIQLRASGRELNELPGNSRAASPTLPSESRSVKRPRNDDPDLFSESSSKKRCTDSLVREQLTLQKKPPAWKDVYRARFKVGTNWKHGRCTVKILKGHSNGVMCLQLAGDTLATGSYDATIKIWWLPSGEEVRTLRGHTSGVRCLQFDDLRLISGALDETIRLWNWRTGECFRFVAYTSLSRKTLTPYRVLQPTIGGIISLNFGPKYLCCGSMDGSIRCWNTCEKTTFSLRGHTDFVNAVKVDSASRTLFSASDDCTVRLWDLGTYLPPCLTALSH